jgi:hypothetical protein
MNKKMQKAKFIAAAILDNCDKHVAGNRSRADWSAEQDRLWRQAAEDCIASEVMRMVCPSLTVPPYAVRKTLREQTLEVGR